MNYIEKVVKSLNLTQLTTLKGLLDTTNPTLRTKVKYINENNKGLNLVYFREGFFNGRLGILVYTDNYCSFFEYNGCSLNPYELNVETHETKHIESCLMTKNDFRSLVEDCKEEKGGSSSEWAEQMKDKIYIDDDDICQHTEPSEFQEDVKFDGTVKVVYPDKFKDSNNDDFSLVPKPANSDLGKFLKVGTTGLMYSDMTPKLYSHRLEMWAYNVGVSDADISYLYIDLPFSTPITTFSNIQRLGELNGKYVKGWYMKSGTKTYFEGFVTSTSASSSNLQVSITNIDTTNDKVEYIAQISFTSIKQDYVIERYAPLGE